MVLLPINVFADTAKSSIAMDLDSGRILYQKNINTQRLIASTTKILTSITVLENSDINRIGTAGKEILKMYGTSIYLEVGEEMKIEDLLYGLLLRSGNDAAVTLAINISGSEKKFVKLMNNTAQKIGMKNSTFQNPHGLDEETKNYSTAYDMALLSKYAYKNDNYRKISSTKKYTVKTANKTYLWYNRNKLLTNYKYCTGGKNGYTPSAGKTLVTTATKNKFNVTVVTLNDSNPYENHKDIYENVYNKYKNYKIVDKNKFHIDPNFTTRKLYLKDSFIYPLTEEEYTKIKTVIDIPNNKSGKIKIYLDNKEIGSIPIYEKETKKKKEKLFLKIKNYLFDILKKFKLG